MQESKRPALEPGHKADRPAPRAEPGAVAKAPRRPRPWLLVAVALVLFGIGFVCSYFVLHSEEVQAPAEPEPPAATVAAPEAPPVPPAAAILRDLKTADGLLREGRFDAALALYQQVEAGPAARAETLQLRTALCLEGLGRTDKALAAYRFAASRGEPLIVRTALIGQARCLIRLGHAAEAKSLLYHCLLRSGSNDLDEPDFLAQAHYLLGLSLAFDTLPRTRPTPLENSLIQPTLEPLRLHGPFPWEQEAETPRTKKDATIVVDQGNPAPQRKLVEIAMEQTTITDVLEDLGKVGGLKLASTDAARQRLEGRTVQIHISGWPLLEVARALAHPVGLCATVKDGVLQLATDEEATRQELAAYRSETARQALQTALLLHPGNRLASAAYLELGNLEAAAGQMAKAISWYERLVLEWPRSGCLIPASYNAGVLYRKQGKREAARKAFYRVVDHNPGHEWTPLALLHIGEIFLDDGEAPRALPPLRRAMAASAGSPTEPAAAVTLAAAHLMTDDPMAANTLLMKHRTILADKAYRANAAFLDAYALYRAAVTRHQTRREAPALLAALIEVHNKSILGPCGKYLIGKAYGDLSMWLEVVQTYEKLLGTCQNLLDNEMTFRVAEALYKLEKRDRALPLLGDLAGRPDPKWSSAARFQLAVIALHENRAKDCLQECQRLRQPNQPVDQLAVLHLMGEAYARLGDHDRAARCYAGQAPD